MNRFIYFFLFLFGCFSTQSCQRKFVHKTHPDFVGHWHHRETNGENWHFNIKDDSWGTITVYDADGDISSKHLYGENPRRWRYNEDKHSLTNGITDECFKVNQLPTLAETTIINGYDTIPAGSTYCIVKDDYYLKTY